MGVETYGEVNAKLKRYDAVHTLFSYLAAIAEIMQNTLRNS
ncbi:MAG: hypothetical protein AAGG51_11655 [Cyanobacteria bacterium P01_G01_bin.54]